MCSLQSIYSTNCLSTLVERGNVPRGVSAACHFSHSPETVHAFLAELDNHWDLSSRRLRLTNVDEHRTGGRVIIAGPLGLRRIARTTVTTNREPHHFGGVAEVGRRTRARVLWCIRPTHGGSRVTLQSTILRLGVLDRTLLALGGRWWLRRGFDRVLSRLGEHLDASR